MTGYWCRDREQRGLRALLKLGIAGLHCNHITRVYSISYWICYVNNLGNTQITQKMLRSIIRTISIITAIAKNNQSWFFLAAFAACPTYLFASAASVLAPSTFSFNSSITAYPSYSVSYYVLRSCFRDFNPNEVASLISCIYWPELSEACFTAAATATLARIAALSLRIVYYFWVKLSLKDCSSNSILWNADTTWASASTIFS